MPALNYLLFSSLIPLTLAQVNLGPWKLALYPTTNCSGAPLQTYNGTASQDCQNINTAGLHSAIDLEDLSKYPYYIYMYTVADCDGGGDVLAMMDPFVGSTCEDATQVRNTADGTAWRSFEVVPGNGD